VKLKMFFIIMLSDYPDSAPGTIYSEKATETRLSNAALRDQGYPDGQTCGVVAALANSVAGHTVGYAKPLTPTQKNSCATNAVTTINGREGGAADKGELRWHFPQAGPDPAPVPLFYADTARCVPCPPEAFGFLNIFWPTPFGHGRSGSKYLWV
jgi:hypothetical protein